MKQDYNPFLLWLTTSFVLLLLTLTEGESLFLFKQGHVVAALLIAFAVPILAIGVFTFANTRVPLNLKG